VEKAKTEIGLPVVVNIGFAVRDEAPAVVGNVQRVGCRSSRHNLEFLLIRWLGHGVGGMRETHSPIRASMLQMCLRHGCGFGRGCGRGIKVAEGNTGASRPQLVTSAGKMTIKPAKDFDNYGFGRDW
jgi:hypothetical protein